MTVFRHLAKFIIIKYIKFYFTTNNNSTSKEDWRQPGGRS